jgi:hypothetical protein
MTIDYAELDRRFSGHYVSEDAVTCLDAVRAAGRAMAVAVCQVAPEGRERALALTKIEEAVFWANAGIARTDEES